MRMFWVYTKNNKSMIYDMTSRSLHNPYTAVQASVLLIRPSPE